MAKGYNVAADIVQQLRVGQNIAQIWQDFTAALEAFNSTRQPLVSLLTTPVGGEVVEDVVQPGTERFEEATEFGVPSAIRAQPVTVQRAYPFKWYDLRQGYTWQFLIDASAAQIDAVLNQAMEASNALMFEHTMKALFNNANRSADILNTAYTVVALYNADGSAIPSYKGLTFPGSHNHYITSGAATLDPQDVTDLALTIEHHGYNRAAGYNIVFLVNPTTEAPVVSSWKRGVVAANSVTSNFDFIPAQGSNMSMLLPPGYTVDGGLPANTFAGMEVIGSWGPYLFVQDYQIPAGYVLAVATQGSGTNTNVIGIREHPQSALRGLVIKPGDNSAYPLINSFFIQGLGAGVRTRGQAAIMQVTAAGSYTVPSVYAW